MPGPEFGYNLLPGLGLFGLSHLLVLVFLAVLTHSRQVRDAPGRAAHRWLVTVPADALGLPFLVPEGPLLLDVCLLFSRGRTVLVAIFWPSVLPRRARVPIEAGCCLVYFLFLSAQS